MFNMWIYHVNMYNLSSIFNFNYMVTSVVVLDTDLAQQYGSKLFDTLFSQKLGFEKFSKRQKSIKYPVCKELMKSQLNNGSYMSAHFVAS